LEDNSLGLLVGILAVSSDNFSKTSFWEGERLGILKMLEDPVNGNMVALDTCLALCFSDAWHFGFPSMCRRKPPLDLTVMPQHSQLKGMICW
jgi:hypothetical protein